MLGKSNLSDDSKRNAVARITERAHRVAEVSRQLISIRNMRSQARQIKSGLLRLSLPTAAKCETPDYALRTWER